MPRPFCVASARLGAHPLPVFGLALVLRHCEHAASLVWGFLLLIPSLTCIVCIGDSTAHPHTLPLNANSRHKRGSAWSTPSIARP
jgi:hypothetical protein